jgi:hypothetical protein
MLATIRLFALALVLALAGRSGDVCPNAVIDKSGQAKQLSWKSGFRRIAAEKFCTEHELTSLETNGPLAVVWQGAGILETKIRGRLLISFCCYEDVATQSANLQTGGGVPNTLATFVHMGRRKDDDDYPDMIEPAAKIQQSRFIGKLWDGSQYVSVDLELRASASHPHFQQSVFEFSITDQSSETVQAEWDLVQEISRKIKPFYTETPGLGYRRKTYVFFGKEQPAPRSGMITLRTASGKFLGRFAAEGFTP